MFALTLQSAKNIAIIIVVALILLAVVVAKFTASVTKKAIMLVLFAAVALGVWTQRQSLQTCADDVRSKPGQVSTCHFFGTDITITSPLPAAPVGG